jgi:hypothetical protein
MTEDSRQAPPNGDSPSRLRDERWATAIVAGYVYELSDRRLIAEPQGRVSDTEMDR